MSLFPPHIHRVPEELKSLNQWVVATAEKVPLNTRTLSAASPTDPSTWSSFSEAVTVAQQNGLRVGFVFAEGGGITGIDLDAPDTPEQEKRHEKICKMFKTYREVSQSRKGAHLICRGSVQRGVRMDKVEVYSGSRYFVMTGESLGETITIADCQDLLDVMFEEMRGRQNEKIFPLVEIEPVKSDDDVMQTAWHAKNSEKFQALWNGELLNNPSHSEADFALIRLLSFYSKSNSQVRRLFRGSVLGKRDKHAKGDYHIDMALAKIRSQQETERKAEDGWIEEAIGPFLEKHCPRPPLPPPTLPQFFPPPPPSTDGEPAQGATAASSGTTQSQAPNPLDFASCLMPASELERMCIPKRLRLLCKWLCESDLGYVFAARGVGKTWLSMALPAAISQAISLGLWGAGEIKARVLYVDGEMPLELTQYRSRGMQVGAGDVVYLHHETLFEKLGTSLNIGLATHRETLTKLLVDGGFKLLILDNLSSLATGVDENKGFDYEQIAGWLLELRRRKITVIVVHHAGRNGLMRGHSKREDALSWILELRDAKSEGEEGAKFISHFAKPSRNTGDSMPDLLWHFTTRDGIVSIKCEEAQTSEYEAFIQHVLDGVDKQVEIAEMMRKNKGTISKWAQKAVREGRILRNGTRLLPPHHAAPG